MRSVLRWIVRVAMVLIVAALAFAAWWVWWPLGSIPPLEPVDEYVWLDQGWGTGESSAARDTYYYTPQGTSMPQGASAGALRYNWFVNLELPFSRQRFAAPEHLRRYRFVVDPEPSAVNPQQLPVGFTKHFDPGIGDYVLDITCAACHTGEIHYTHNNHNVAIRIDGGPAMHAFTDMSRGDFAPLLLTSMINTAVSPWKFDRFARAVLGPAYPAAKPKLRSALWASIRTMLSRGQNSPFRKLYPLREGFGRTDALGRIGNTVFGDHLVESNYQVGDGPVSFPYLWNIWKFDWVQYNGSVAQPLARNIGEALGVGAITPWRNTIEQPLPPGERFRSSVDIPGLHRIEQTLQTLRPPRWPEDILGAIDQQKAARGSQLFEQYCRECHGPHIAEPARQHASAPLKAQPDTVWRMEVIPLEHIGTDENAANGFMNRRYDLSATGLTHAELEGALRPLLVRSLARDTLFRLTEVVRLREAANLPAGGLPALLAAYPDPDANATAQLPSESFSAIEAALNALLTEQPSIPDATRSPYDPLDCTLECHTRHLLWNVRNGVANIDYRVASLDPASISEGLALNLVGIMIRNRFYADYNVDYATQQCLEGFGALDLPQQIAGYKPRPLEGVWATAPFLHNGSVPSLYEMLLPPDKRTKKFFVGRRDFDPVHVGFVTEPVAGNHDGFWLDTSIAGNRNTGHGFAASADEWQKYRQDPHGHPLPKGVIGPELSDDERFALIEYLKVHRDAPETAVQQPARCHLWSRT